MDNSGLKGKVVVITGASSGFGRGAALRFAAEGACLVLAARRGEVLDEIVAECKAAGAHAFAVATDVSREEDVRRLAWQAVDKYGRIDVWINNAGVGAIGRFERIPLADHHQVVSTNLLGTLYGAYHAYRQFLAQKSGVLINVASELGGHTGPFHSSYAAAEHGIVGLSDSLRQEVAQSGMRGVHICTVLPSAHDTPFFDHAANYSGHEVQAPKPLNDPQGVIETLVALARDPQDRRIVGARTLHQLQMEDAPAAPDTPGALRAPMHEGTGVSAGRRERR